MLYGTKNIIIFHFNLKSIPMNTENKTFPTPLVVGFYNKESLDCYTILLLDSATSKTIPYVSASKTGRSVYQHGEINKWELHPYCTIEVLPTNDIGLWVKLAPKHLGRYVSFSTLDKSLQKRVKAEFKNDGFDKVNYSEKYSYIRNF